MRSARDARTGTGLEPAGLPPMPDLAGWLLFHAEQRPDAPAVTSRSGSLTYRELADRVRTLAADMCRRGVAPRDRVLLALPNTTATIVAGLAVNLIGAVSVEVSRDWSADILADIVARSGTRHLVIAGRDAAAWGRALPAGAAAHAWVVHPGPLPATLREALGPVPATHVGDDGSLDIADVPLPAIETVHPAPDAPALILYTSGSTGRPHGVIQTVGNVDANSRSIVEYLGLTSRDRALLALPLYYCYGRSVLQTHLLAGGSVVLEGRMAFPRMVMETIAAEACTGFAGVPLTFEIIRRQVDMSTISLPSLRYVTQAGLRDVPQAGGGMSPDTIAWARDAFAPASLFVMYGQTEATARLSYLPPDRAGEKQGSIGIPIPGVELRVVGADGRELPPGEIGELIARGANVTPGYLEEPAETAEILRDGWLWTGDLAERDSDGFLYHRGRAKEILKVGGRRASPLEIEHVIAAHPGVAEVGVAGRPDGLMGEVPVAFVVPRSGATPDEADIITFCQARLPAPLVPASVLFLDALPRNEAGKILRVDLAIRLGSR